MAGSRTGTPTIIKLSRRICRLIANHGASDLLSHTSDAFVAAVLALQTACLALEALDDQPFQIDQTGPISPRDPDLGPGA